MSEAVSDDMFIDWFYKEVDAQVKEDGEELTCFLGLPFNIQTC